MKIPRPRRLAAIVVVGAIGALLSLSPRGPWPDGDFKDLRDSVGDHASALSAGHASLGKGASSCVFCHFVHNAKAQRPLWQKEGRSETTSFSADSARFGGQKTGLCLSCHDGSIASTLNTHGGSPSSSRSQYRSPDMSASHPVGVDYMAVSRARPDEYNDSTLNPKIVLEEGKVGCVSCHATHDPATLSASNVRQEVCIECHRR